MPISLLKVEDSLTRVRAGLESRARRIEGRVGQELAAFVSRPGKMLRSRFCLLLGGALGVPEDKSEAASRALELVHNASLLHDDCVDEATLRRSHPTPNAVYNIPTALLLGDLAFSQGLEEAVDISPNAARLLVTAVREMTVGELQEEFLKGSLDLSVDAYMGICSRKTRRGWPRPPASFSSSSTTSTTTPCPSAPPARTRARTSRTAVSPCPACTP